MGVCVYDDIICGSDCMETHIIGTEYTAGIFTIRCEEAHSGGYFYIRPGYSRSNASRNHQRMIDLGYTVKLPKENLFDQLYKRMI